MSIEKLDFDTISRESIPYTTLSNKVIQNISNHLAFAVWAFLQSLPQAWIVNKVHIMNHFRISEKTYKRTMSYLKKSNLVEYRRERRTNGTMGPVNLIVLNGSNFIDLKMPDPDSSNTPQPAPDNDFNHGSNNDPMVQNDDFNHRAKNHPGGLPTLVVNDPTYINTISTTNTKKEEKDIHTHEADFFEDEEIADKPKNPFLRPIEYHEGPFQAIQSLNDVHCSTEANESFEIFYSLYPVKKGKARAMAAWYSQGCAAKFQEIISKLQLQLAKDCQYLTGFAPYPFRYITEERWKDEIQIRKINNSENRKYNSDEGWEDMSNHI